MNIMFYYLRTTSVTHAELAECVDAVWGLRPVGLDYLVDESGCEVCGACSLDGVDAVDAPQVVEVVDLSHTIYCLLKFMLLKLCHVFTACGKCGSLLVARASCFTGM